MAQTGSPDDLHVTLAPLAAGEAAKSRRTGYLALVASGLITATAFAGIADLASSTIPIASPNNTPVQEFERERGVPAPGSGLVPGEAYPQHGEISVSGAAVAETFRPRNPLDPTLVVITNPDGTRTTTVVPAPAPGTTGNGASTTNPPGSSTSNPPSSTTGNPTTDPTTTDPTTTDPTTDPTTTEPSTTEPSTTEPEPTTSDPEEPTSGTSSSSESPSSSESSSSSSESPPPSSDGND